MHSRSKAGAQSVSVEEAAGRAAQVRKYIQAKDLFLQRRRAGVMDDKSRELTARLIALNPDLYPLWNFRREMYLASSQQQSAAAHTADAAHGQAAVLLSSSSSHARVLFCLQP